MNCVFWLSPLCGGGGGGGGWRIPVSRFLKGRSENLVRKRRLRSEMTRSERLVWSRIRAKQFQALKFRRQHGIGPYLVDFYCPERVVVIEIDGDVHAGGSQAARDQ